MKLKFYMLDSWDSDVVCFGSKREAMKVAHMERRNGRGVEVQRITTADLSPLKMLMCALTDRPGDYDHLCGWVAERETIYEADGVKDPSDVVE